MVSERGRNNILVAQLNSLSGARKKRRFIRLNACVPSDALLRSPDQRPPMNLMARRNRGAAFIFFPANFYIRFFALSFSTHGAHVHTCREAISFVGSNQFSVTFTKYVVGFLEGSFFLRGNALIPKELRGGPEI